MKILHTADWHLGKKLESVPRLEEQVVVMEEICNIADKEEVDAVIVAGDLFDQYNPSAEAVELYYKTLKKLSKNGNRMVLAIAGNHDSPDRIEAPDPLARECGIIFSGYPDTVVPHFRLESGIEVSKSSPGFVEIQLPQYDYPLRVIFTPYANEYRLKKFLGLENEDEELRQFLQRFWSELADQHCDENGVNILTAHLFVGKKGEEIQDEPDDEKPILHVGGAQVIWTENFPKAIQYVALGHLHRYQIVNENPCPIVYSSSPLSYSFAEANQTKFVVIVEAEPGVPVNFRRIPIEGGKKLLRNRFESIDEALEWLSENQESLVEITIVSDHYLTSLDRKRLIDAHQGVVTIIPELSRDSESANSSKIDLSQDMEALFIQYFEFKYQQKPGDEILELFKEIRAETNNE